jgi:hypothetical protein
MGHTSLIPPPLTPTLSPLLPHALHNGHTSLQVTPILEPLCYHTASHMGHTSWPLSLSPTHLEPLRLRPLQLGQALTGQGHDRRREPSGLCHLQSREPQCQSGEKLHVSGCADRDLKRVAIGGNRRQMLPAGIGTSAQAVSHHGTCQCCCVPGRQDLCGPRMCSAISMKCC